MRKSDFETRFAKIRKLFNIFFIFNLTLIIATIIKFEIMKKSLIKSIKALSQHFVSCRSYSFIDWVQTIGGFLVMMYIPLLIGMIWFDTTIMLKAIATNSVLVIGIWIVDRSHNGR